VLGRQYGDAVVGLLTTTNQVFDRVAMHAVRREVLDAQAKAAQLPLQIVPLPWPCTNEDYERLMEQAAESAVPEGFTHVAFGDLFLEDVRRYREERLAGTGRSRCSRYGASRPGNVRARCSHAAFVRLLVPSTRKKLDASFASRAYDLARLATLPPSVHPCGEHGEFHTCDWDGPMFQSPLELFVGETVHRDGLGMSRFDANRRRLRTTRVTRRFT
jgi:diphthamide synthase (EF-2-diphthine--ammonia ligase)